MSRKKLLLILYLSLILSISAKKIRKSFPQEQNPCVVEFKNVKYDLNRFYKNEGYVTQEGNTKYYLNICGATLQCKTAEFDNVASCEVDIKSKNVTITGLANYMTILRKYEPMPGLSYTNPDLSTKKKMKVSIEFQCNQHSKFPILKYVVPAVVGKNRHFVFQSRYFCLKQVESYCQIVNSVLGFSYNLYPLHNEKDYIINEANQLSSSIFLNICGNLSTKLQGDCSDDNTQICMLNKLGEYKNLGTLPQIGKNLDNEGFFSITFTDGSLCMDKQYIETKIDFQCSLNESEIFLINSTSCQYNILWKTRHACPNYNKVHHFCAIKSDHFYNENRIFSFPSITKNITQSKNNLFITLDLHLCNPIRETINCGETNASVCLNNGKKSINYGFHNTTILSQNGALKMELYGENCYSDVPYMTTINFHCAYSVNKQNFIEITNTSTCSIVLNFYTKLACPIINPKNNRCIVGQGNQTFDLGPLSKLDDNYEIEDSFGIIYSINLCRPLVYGKNTLCSQDSMICLYNRSKPIFTHRYKSLANYLNEHDYYLNDNHLTAKYSGGMCKNAQSYSTELQFICDPTAEKKYPKLLFHGDCKFVFEWYTKYACQVPSSTVATEIPRNEIIKQTETPQFEKVDQNPTKIKIEHTGDILHPILPKIERQDEILNDGNSEKLGTIFIENCAVIDRIHTKKLNFTNFPHNLKVISKDGNIYSLSFCDTSLKDMNKCESPICGGSDLKVPYGSISNIDLNIDEKRQQIFLRFLGYRKCKHDFYNASIILKCSESYEIPTVIKEDLCSVHFEWYNNATCALLGIKPTSNKTNNSNSIYIISITVPIILLFIFIIICYVFIRKYRKYLPYYHRVRKSSIVLFYTKNSED